MWLVLLSPTIHPPSGPKQSHITKYQQDKGASQVVLVVKKPPANAGDVRDTGSIPVWEDPLEEGIALHSSILAWRSPMDRGAWWATVHEFAKSQT